MALLERRPDNTAIDAELRKFGIDPTTIADLPEGNPTEIPAEMWALTDIGAGAWGVVGRPRAMRYEHGEQRTIGSGVANPTSEPIRQTLTASEPVDAWASFPISPRVQAGFLTAVEAAVATAFGQTWTTEKTFTESLEVTVPPGHMAWLEARPILRVLEADFVAFFRATVPDALQAWRFTGTVTAPGGEGDLKDVIEVHRAPMTTEITEGLLSAAQAMARSGSPRVRRADDGTISPRGCIMKLLAGDAARGEDVTDRVGFA
ncbi:hypothetical protein OG948_36620 (plasmid) [Embleya sp. NBC_00888]|uniref:hypothetical protein n=1 Tax=Embleya sp. NBC_00888 TaxID=2975960 RepID=UPI002F91A1CE|nr:hypothetical protein OG948_36620 [Embleya sp. NBC_00888]